jgi:hypothetical protein
MVAVVAQAANASFQQQQMTLSILSPLETKE